MNAERKERILSRLAWWADFRLLAALCENDTDELQKAYSIGKRVRCILRSHDRPTSYLTDLTFSLVHRIEHAGRVLLNKKD